MTFKRILAPESFATGNELTRQMMGIGIKIGSIGRSENPNIEDTIVAAVLEGVEGDYRVLSLISDWFEVHRDRVNVDRLLQLVKGNSSIKLRAFFSAIGKMFGSDPRFLRLSRCYRGRQVDLLDDETEFLLNRNGEDERFKDTALRVPKLTLRHRLEDIETPAELASKHRDYYYRILIGSSYRADMVSLLERVPALTPSEVARRTYGSFQTAWCVKNDLELIGVLNPSRVRRSSG
jgi:hypothetical protein